MACPFAMYTLQFCYIAISIGAKELLEQLVQAGGGQAGEQATQDDLRGDGQVPPAVEGHAGGAFRRHFFWRMVEVRMISCYTM